MKGEGKEGDKSTRTYFFKRCHPCGIKLHMSDMTCWKCGRRLENMSYGSKDPSDALYCTQMNRVEICMNCWRTQNEMLCKPIICFGTGRGECDHCRQFETGRFDCCQDLQQKEKAVTAEERQRLMNLTEPKKYDDKIPF